MSASTIIVKPLVLCADDYGQSVAIGAAVRALVAQGRLTATSAMVLAPHWPAEAARLAEWRGRIDVGLHLDWTSPFAIAAGHGLTLGATMRRALLGGFDVTAARGEIERQLDAFETAWGAPPDHVDGHQHVQQFAGIREPLVELLARRYGARAPWLRLSRAPVGQRHLKARVIAWMGADALEAMAARAGIPCAVALSGIYDFDGDEVAYGRRMAAWLRTSPAGTVLMCHPAMPSDGAWDDPIVAARVREWRCLDGDDFAACLDSAGVQPVRGSVLYDACLGAEAIPS